YISHFGLTDQLTYNFNKIISSPPLLCVIYNFLMMFIIEWKESIYEGKRVNIEISFSKYIMTKPHWLGA
ncbi:hypothetical protein KAH49_12570, partial [Providencia rettgeri]|uniref:hypothetical protein n=1 Tax=Providencia rettgeri TaxID=587 RepID=UPI001B38868F